MRVKTYLLVLLFLTPTSSLAELRNALRSVYKVGASYADGSAAGGSAVLIEPGKLVTSCHTLRDAQRISILYRENALPARASKAAWRHDLCILSVPQLRGPVVDRLPSSALEVGEAVVAVGFGDRFSRSVQGGHVTALYQMDGANVVRTSAGFPRGASGGALFSESGALVGVLTFRGTADDGLNYAVPTEWVEVLLEADARPRAASGDTQAFWEDDFKGQPKFLDAAWLESAQAWGQLAELALDWTLSTPEDPEAWIALGRAYLGVGQPKESVLALRAAVAINPRHVLAWYWLAVAYHEIGFQGHFLHASHQVAVLDEQRAAELDERTRRENP